MLFMKADFIGRSLKSPLMVSPAAATDEDPEIPESFDDDNTLPDLTSTSNDPSINVDCAQE